MSATTLPPTPPPAEADPPGEPAEQPAGAERKWPDESRNLLTLATSYVFLRVAWIFKTESVIVPLALDAVSGGSPTIRGILPLISRCCQGFVPLMLVDRVRRTPRKSRALSLATFGLAVPFLVLALGRIGFPNASGPLPTAVFLIAYAVFFSIGGTHIMLFGVTQGKLIRPERRGRLLALSGIVGSAVAITAAVVVLPPIVARLEEYLPLLFLLSVAAFVASGLLLLTVRESPSDPPSRPGRPLPEVLLDAVKLPARDRNFRRLVVVAMLFMPGLALFPHYVSLAKSLPQVAEYSIVFWLVAQNASVGLGSPIAGSIADRFGNRLALWGMLVLSALPPTVGLLASAAGSDVPLWLMFASLGVFPITFRILANYALELTVEDQHPVYLSTLKIWTVAPMLFSPLVGTAIGVFGFPPVLWCGLGFVAIAAIAATRLVEPRRGGFVPFDPAAG